MTRTDSLRSRAGSRTEASTDILATAPPRECRARPQGRRRKECDRLCDDRGSRNDARRRANNGSETRSAEEEGCSENRPDRGKQHHGQLHPFSSPMKRKESPRGTTAGADGIALRIPEGSGPTARLNRGNTPMSRTNSVPMMTATGQSKQQGYCRG